MSAGCVRCRRYSQGKYVKVIGTIRTFQNTRSLNVTMIKLVTDHNQVRHHLSLVLPVPVFSHPLRSCCKLLLQASCCRPFTTLFTSERERVPPN